ncbi:MAG: sulfite oxidase [Pseudomonadota bacterium]
MGKKLRVMTEVPLNAETPNERLTSWITAEEVFFDRNQGEIPSEPIALSQWQLTVDGEVQTPLELSFEQISRMPKAISAATLECSGNGRSLLKEKAPGNTWTIGGVGNAVWGGVWLKTVLEKAGLTANARHVAFEGMDRPRGSAQISFIRSIPLEKALDSTLLAYEMNGAPLPLKRGYPMRVIALGWTGANCTKWLKKITVLDRPFEGFFMDQVYRKFQKGQDRKTGEVVTEIGLKSIIARPENGDRLSAGDVTVLGAAYAGENRVIRVDVSTDAGQTWNVAEWIGPDVPFAWRQWQYVWSVEKEGEYTIMARATDAAGRRQPMEASWNALGYGNNGVLEHAVTVTVSSGAGEN